MSWISGQLALGSIQAIGAMCTMNVVLSYVYSPWAVTGASMEPTLINKDRIWVQRWRKFFFQSFKKGDVVVLKSPSIKGDMWVKRIISLPGDVAPVPDLDGNPMIIPQGHVWVEGDNRSRSNDSRRLGPVPLALIEGKVTSVIWPPKRIKRVQTELKKWQKPWEAPVIDLGALVEENFYDHYDSVKSLEDYNEKYNEYEKEE
eukprot:TRINITY_DN15186_c0_g1_i1.p1 TRINITY_DN15186_c0_g1~~TRINITY_DN15186_c0_g1_i1.p1  ORF type:complete len:202 (+),score=36.71 TRINITY_DN15186_c0_g1_i1:24-629(+)